MWKSKTAARLTSIEGDLDGFRKALETLERQPKLLKIEWEDTLDRINRVMGRLNARIKVAATQNEELPAGNSELTPPAKATPSGIHARLQVMRARKAF